jgi:hypothetical protein
MCLSVFSITLYLPWLVCDASSIALSCIHTFASCISSRYARCTMWRTWCGAEPKDSVGGSIPKMKGAGVHAWSGDVIKTVQANLTNSCRIPGKPRSIINLLISEMQLSTMLYIVALSYRCWMKILAALIFNPCPENIPWILCSSGSSRCLALL